MHENQSRIKQLIECSRAAARDTLIELRREGSKPKTDEEFLDFEERLAAATCNKIYQNPLINNSDMRIALREEIGVPTPILLDGRHVNSIGQKKNSRMFRNRLTEIPKNEIPQDVPQDGSASSDQFCQVVNSSSDPVNLLSPSPKKKKTSYSSEGRVRGALVRLCRVQTDSVKKSKIRQAAKSLSTDQFHQEILESEEKQHAGSPKKGSSQNAAFTILDLCQDLDMNTP